MGYLVHAPGRALDGWGGEAGEVEVHVSTQVREDAIALYGFSTWEDRAVFESLLGVTGIGPRIALACIDTMNAEALSLAIRDSDVHALSRVPGVGRKTAQRLALELRDKLPALAAGPARPSRAAAAPPDDGFAAALQRLGYTRAEIDLARQRLAGQGIGEETTLSERLRAALRVLYER